MDGLITITIGLIVILFFPIVSATFTFFWDKQEEWIKDKLNG